MKAKMMSKVLVPSVLGLFLAGDAFAAGFQLNEQNARATGRASAVVATIDDASAIWHNPAGLTRTRGTEFMAGLSLIVVDNGYTGPGLPSTNPNFPNDVDEQLSRGPSPVPHVYVSRQLSERAWVGLGFYPSYGSGNDWEDPNNWVGRTQIEQIALRTFFFTPTVALKVTDWLSVGVGLQLVPASVKLEQTLGDDVGNVLFPRVTPDGQDGRLEVYGDAFGVGATAGLTVELLEHLRLGFTYRSSVDLSFEGEADFDLPPNVPAEVRANFPDQTGNAELTVPHTFLWGVGWEMEDWVIDASVQLTLWDSYDELRLNFDTGRPRPFNASPRNWEVVPMLRLGGEYRLDQWAFRTGVAYDATPAPLETVEPGLPDGNRFNIAGGVGYDFGPVRFDLAYMAVILAGRDLDETDDDGELINVFPLRGEYTGGVQHVIAATLGVRI